MNAKKIFALLMSLLMVFTTLSGVLMVSADETADKFAPTNEETVNMYVDGEQGAAHGGYGIGKTVGAKVSVPEGKRLTQINFHSLATYNENVNQILFSVYQWDTDYKTTVAGDVLAQTLIVNHTDNAALNVVLPTNRNLTGELLWVASYIAGAQQMTPWSLGSGTLVEGVQCFANGAASSTPFMFGITTGDALTVEPASYTATFMADGAEVAKVTFLEGDTMLFNIPEVPAKEGFWGDWAEYTLSNADITIEAVYTDASGAVKPEITDCNKMTAFAEDHATYLKGQGCQAIVNRDGSLSFVGTWVEGGDVDAYANIEFLNLMKKYYDKYEKMSSIPNKNTKFKAIAFKVVAPAVSLDDTPNLTVVIGRNTEIYGVEVANNIVCDGTEEYWIFDFSDEPDFTTEVINTMSLNWAYSIGDETNIGAEFKILGFEFFNTVEDALAATGGEAATEPPTEPKTEAPTDEPTEAPTADAGNNGDNGDTTTDDGCASVIGMGAVAVLAAAAAFVALKKKD